MTRWPLPAAPPGTDPVALTRHAGAPLQPDAEQARAWAEQELLHPEYHADRPSLIQQALGWLLDQLHRLTDVQAVPGKIGVAVLTGLLLALVAYLVWRGGGLHPRARTRAAGVFEPRISTAADHRAAATAAAAAGDLHTAVIEQFRALMRALADRGLIRPEPGSTAVELARQAAAALPGFAGRLAAAAATFDEASYGGRTTGPEAFQSLRELDAQLERAQLERAQRR